MKKKRKILTLYEGNNIFQYDPIKKVAQEFPLSGLPEKFSFTSAEIYAGKLYVLDDSADEIYRFPKLGNSFGSPTSWIKNGKEYLEDARAIAIDGGIYILTKDKLFRFFSGSFEKEIPLFINPTLENPKQIWTESESNLLYFLDPPTKRMVSTTKEGKINKQWTSSQWNDLQNFIVDEKGGKIYLLNGLDVYEINL